MLTCAYSRRDILRLGGGAVLAAVIANLSSPFNRSRVAGAQTIDPAYANDVIDALNLPTLEIVHTASGYQVPGTTTAGLHTVILRAETDLVLYADFMQYPATLSLEEATPIALAAGSSDLVEPGWTFAGGNNADAHSELRFIVDLPAGDWVIATSTYNDATEEVMTLHPFPVTAALPGASPVASPVASPATVRPAGDVVMQLNDVEFGGIPEAIPAGTTFFEITNIGKQPRQMVLFRTPRALTVADFEAMFANRQAGTPDPTWTATVWVGYAALLSPGFTQWVEFDLEPGIYTATSWVIDPETQMPALLLGMVQSFTVE